MRGKFVTPAGFLVAFITVSVSLAATVEVVRGSQTEASESSAAQVVLIIRGDVPEAVRRDEPGYSEQPVSAPKLVTSGRNLWVLDEDGGTITGCELRDSYLIPIGEARAIKDVRCRTERWPQDRIYYLGMHHRL